MSKHQFQAEVQQLLNLMIHSLYSEGEIFLRELVSNASDACDKLRFQSLTDTELIKGDEDLHIDVSFDKDANTVTITDNGIGLNMDEAQNNLGTIAKSGTKEFLSSVEDGQQDDLKSLIGQFGVGFYSSFIVADRVVVESRSARVSSDEGVRWESSGDGSFEVESISRPQRGTSITLHLRDNSTEYADAFRLRGLIKKYSNFISYPIFMDKTLSEEEEKEGKAVEAEQINESKALWTKSKSDVSEEEYKEFYKTACKQWDEPATWVHFNVEGTLTFSALLYIPGSKPFDMFDNNKGGLSLYVRRVFIMDQCEDLLPEYLRFVKGVVDSDDLPLNVSREILQQQGTVSKLQKQLVKRVLDHIRKLSVSKKEDERKIFDAINEHFGSVLREGIVRDLDNKDKVAGLARFQSSWTTEQEHEGEFALVTGLDDYIERMAEGQEKIYIITAANLAAAKGSPHIEGYLNKGYEVLYLCDPVDEWVAQHLTEYKDKQIVNINSGSDDLSTDEEKEELEKLSESYKPFMEFAQGCLGDDIKEVRLSKRLTDSPCCIVNDANAMTSQMEEILRRSGQAIPPQQRILEINPEHSIVKKLYDIYDDEARKEHVGDYFQILRDQALLADGSPIKDTAAFAKRIQNLMNEAV